MSWSYGTLCVVCYVGTSVSEDPVASIFRLKLSFIVIIDVMVLWYVMCGLCRYQRFGGSCCLHPQIKITIYHTHGCHGLIVRDVWFVM